MKTLHRTQSPLSDPGAQVRLLNEPPTRPKFSERLAESALWPLRPTAIDTLQINVGKLCNQVCSHCHVDAGPDRTENMTRETFEACLNALRTSGIRHVDLTGGAPEMNPHFRWFVAEAAQLGCTVLVRCNLTILLAGKAYEDLPVFFAAHRVHVVSSLPCYEKKNTDGQRGIGVFEKSLEALRRLNAVGYGREGSGLVLDLVYNPTGAFLPPPQTELAAVYKRELKKNYDLDFNELVAITNLPISRFLDSLVAAGKLDEYMARLVSAYNPKAVAAVMCRNLLSVGWDGRLYDCDFNQMLAMEVAVPSSRHIADFDLAKLQARAIRVDQHCFGCTAGQGSSCGGSLTSA